MLVQINQNFLTPRIAQASLTNQLIVLIELDARTHRPAVLGAKVFDGQDKKICVFNELKKNGIAGRGPKVLTVRYHKEKGQSS